LTGFTFDVIIYTYTNKTGAEMDIKSIVAEGVKKAQEAGQAMYAQVGERDACGFGWVEVYVSRTNSKEAKALIEAGFRKDYKPKCLSMWDPAGVNTQSISVKEAGAYAMAKVLSDAGLKAYAGSRLD
jgi:hypothetical protein